MNKFENIGKRRDIEEILNDLSLLYTEKITSLLSKLRELLNENVVFNDDMSENDELLMKISNVTSCMNEKCSEKKWQERAF